MKAIEKEASKLLNQVRKLDTEIKESEQELNELKEMRRAKYTRLNQLAKQLRKGILEL